MPGVYAIAGCQDCCVCPTRVCVNARCGTGAVSGASVTIREAADPPHSGTVLGTGTTNATGGFCTTVAIASSVDIQVTKTGYHPFELTDQVVPCTTGRSFLAGLLPARFDFTFQLEGCKCQDSFSVSLSDGTDTYTAVLTVRGETLDDIRLTGDFAVPEDGGDVLVSVTISPVSSTAYQPTTTCWFPVTDLDDCRPRSGSCKPDIADDYVCCCVVEPISPVAKSCDFFLEPRTLYLTDDVSGSLPLGHVEDWVFPNCFVPAGRFTGCGYRGSASGGYASDVTAVDYEVFRVSRIYGGGWGCTKRVTRVVGGRPEIRCYTSQCADPGACGDDPFELAFPFFPYELGNVLVTT